MNFAELCLGCRTYRRFTQEPIPDEVLQELLVNARVASCGKNAQSLRFTLVKSAEPVAKMQPLLKWAGSLPPGVGTPKEGEQPTAFVIISKIAEAGPLSDIDVGIAIDTMAKTAYAHGVGSCMMFSVNRPEVQKLLGLPESEEIRLVLSLGYPGHKSTIVDISVGDDTKYWMDENKDYVVPKYRLDEITRII